METQKLKVLAVCGSPRQNSRSMELLRHLMHFAEEFGAQVRLLDLGESSLPLFNPDGADVDETERLGELSDWADAFFVASPEYHGGMSATVKNYFDSFQAEFAGKLFGLAVSTGRGVGMSSLTHMRTTIHCCHGWVLPYQVGAAQDAFDPQGFLVCTDVVDRLRSLARDLTTYAPMLYRQFCDDSSARRLPASFAAWHVTNA